MELTKLSETVTTITLGWTPVAGAKGYLLWREKSATVAIPSGGTRPRYTQTFDPLRDEASFTKDSEWYKVEAIASSDVGEYPGEEPPPPPSPDGDDVVLVNEKWSPAGNWGAKDLVDVRILDTSVRRDAIALAGSGTVRRVYIEQHSGDGIKLGQAVTGPVVLGSYGEQSELLMRDVYGDVHSDNCQAMGGKNATFIGFYSKKFVPSNSCFFANQGSGMGGRPEDIVWEFTVFGGMRAQGDHRGGTPIKLNDSLRCGIRHCLVVNSGLVAPLTVGALAVDPVVVDSYSMTHAAWDAAGGDDDGPRHRDLWNADGSHKPLLDQLIASGAAKRLSA